MEPSAFSGFPLGWAADMDLRNTLAEKGGDPRLPAHCPDISREERQGEGLMLDIRGSFQIIWIKSTDSCPQGKLGG